MHNAAIYDLISWLSTEGRFSNTNFSSHSTPHYDTPTIAGHFASCIKSATSCDREDKRLVTEALVLQNSCMKVGLSTDGGGAAAPTDLARQYYPQASYQADSFPASINTQEHSIYTHDASIL